MKINGLKKAVGDYQKLNAGGPYSPRYGIMYYDSENGVVWTDEHYDLGHNTRTIYTKPSIHNIGNAMQDADIPVNMANVKKFVEMNF